MTPKERELILMIERIIARSGELELNLTGKLKELEGRVELLESKEVIQYKDSMQAIIGRR